MLRPLAARRYQRLPERGIDDSQRTFPLYIGHFGKAEHTAQLLKLVAALKSDLKELGGNATDEQAAQVFGKQVDQLLSLSKCPDLVVNRGHYFGTDFLEPGEKAGVRPPGLSDADKKALIEFLKTF